MKLSELDLRHEAVLDSLQRVKTYYLDRRNDNYPFQMSRVDACALAEELQRLNNENIRLSRALAQLHLEKEEK